MRPFHYFLAELPRSLSFPALLSECGYYTDATGGWKGRRERTIEFGFRLSSDSNSSVDFVEGNEYRKELPHFIIKSPEMIYYSRMVEPREVFFVVYREAVIPFLRESGFVTDFSYFQVPDPERIRSCAVEMESVGSSLYAKGAADRLDMLAFQLLHEFFLHEKKTVTGGYYEKKILDIASYLRLFFRSKIKFDELLCEHGLSRRTFFRYWNKSFSVTPKAYVDELRFQEALHLLINTDLPVSMIAEQLQYPDVSYFCHHFKRRFKMTPRQVRK